MRLAVTLLSFTAAVSTVNANVLIQGTGPFGTLTDASITIPAGNDSAISFTQTSNYSQTFDITVTGAPDGDEVALYFAGEAGSYAFFGGMQAEYLESFSTLTIISPLFTSQLATQPFLPQGSTPSSCSGLGSLNCAAIFSFGQTATVTFTALSFISYSFNPFAGPPTLSGTLSATAVNLFPFVYVYDVTTREIPDSATVTFADAATPEGATFLLIGAGLLLMCYTRKRVGALPIPML